MRVVLTGLGTINPLGTTVDETWRNLLKGQSGIELLQIFTNLTTLGASVKLSDSQLNEKFNFSNSDEKMMHRASKFALISTDEAIQDSQLNLISDLNRERIGISIGNSTGSLACVGENIKKTLDGSQESNFRRISPFFIPKVLQNTPAGLASMRYKFYGPNHCVSTACTSGAHSIGDAFLYLKNGMSDVMIAGATESSLDPWTIAGFSQAKALISPSYVQNELDGNIAKASQPFNHKRSGFVIAEGSAVMVLEVSLYCYFNICQSLEHFLKTKSQRPNAKIYCEITGYGMSSDAFHITAPHPDGLGAFLSMKNSVHQNLQVNLINAHATSTKIGDKIELIAITKFIEHQNMKNPIYINANKSSLGHLLGAAGAVESLITALSLHHQIIPPNLNFEKVEDGTPMHPLLVINQEKIENVNIERAISNSFGFGGTNATLCFSRFWQN